MKYQFRVLAYFPLLMTDGYRPDKYHALNYEIDYPEGQSRIVLIFLKLPSFLFTIVQTLIEVATLVLLGNGFVTGWCILFTRKYPKSLYETNKSILSWTAQTMAWQYLMRDDAKLFGTTRAVKIWVSIGIVGTIILVLADILPTFYGTA
jgi:hypothetical protein